MSDAWQCPVWHPGDCEGTPACPPRCPRHVTPDGTAITVYEHEDRLVAVDDTGRPLAGVDPVDGTASLELASDAPVSVGVEIARQVVARAHERGDDLLVIEAEDVVLEPLTDELDAAVHACEPGRLVLDPTHPTASPLTLAPASGADVPPADRIDALVDPETVAVFGATDRDGSIGRVLVENLAGFEGEILPVNPRLSAVCGISTVTDLDAHTVDLAVIALPADAVIDAVYDAAAAGADAVAILSAGFGETGGTDRERDLAAALDETGLTAVGPNALGVLSTRSRLNATFAPTTPDAGGLSVVSHSGAMITAILQWAAATGIGVRDIVSLGNGVDLTAAELVRYWGRDPGTTMIAAYLEDLPDGRAFVEAARDVTPSTPIVALKAGRTTAGAAAASSHTGAVAGDDAGYDAAFDAAGVIRATGQDAFFDQLAMLSNGHLPRSPAVAVVTNAGGPGVIAADAVADAGLPLASFSPATVDRLEGILPDAASIANPIDVLGDADVDRFLETLEAVLADPEVGAALVTTSPHPLVSHDDLVAGITELQLGYGVPVVVTVPGMDTGGSATASAGSVVQTSDAGRAARTLAALARYARNRRQPRAGIDPIGADRGAVTATLERAMADRRQLGVESLSLLEAYGVSVAETRLISDADEAGAAVEAVGGDAVLKAVAPSLAHKTDVGGVVTGVTPSTAAEAYRNIVEDVTTARPDATLDGVAVQAAVAGGVELLVGVTTHRRFGPVVTVGLGGVLVEHLDDVAHGLAPLSTAAARELLDSLAGASLLRHGPRGGAPPSLDALAEAIARISRLAADHEAIHTLEVNPLLATPNDAIAVDLLVELAP